MIHAKIVGATGYGGVGIVELLLRHPEVHLQCLVAKAETGMPLSDLYPHLDGHCDMTVLPGEHPDAQAPADVVFFATPDRVGMSLARAELDKGAKVIDYSGDFRFRDAADYAEYATRIGKNPTHADPDLLPRSVYGIPELGLPETPGPSPDRDIVGNPGCFAVASLLGLAPAAAHALAEPTSLICDCKTGVSGAGKTPKPGFHYPTRYDHMNAYKLAGHQHVCEIERTLTQLADTDIRVTFTAQVVPATRGILATLYGRLAPGQSRASVTEAYKDYYRDRPFIRVYDRDTGLSNGIGTAHVRGGNYCTLIVDADERTQTLRVVSHIDNLMKGQAGSALQNMNLLFGFPETMGLEIPGLIP